MAMLHDMEVDDYLAECVRLDDVALDEEFMRLPADLAYWTQRYANAVDVYLRAKLVHEQTVARIYMEARSVPETPDVPETSEVSSTAPVADQPSVDAPADGKPAKKGVAKPPKPKPAPKPKQASVDDAKQSVVTDPAYETTYLDMVKADVEKTRLRGLVDAISAKRDMLQSLGAKLRAEMERDPMVRARVADRREG